MVTVWSSRWGLSEVIRMSWASGYLAWASVRMGLAEGVADGVAFGVISIVF